MLVVMDLDGTLLRPDLKLSSFTRDVLVEVSGLGVHLGYSTSRSPEKARSLVDSSLFTAPSVTLNGAVIVLPRTGQVLQEHPLAPAAVERLLCVRSHSPFLLGRDGNRDVLAYTSGLSALQQRHLDERVGDPRLRFMPKLLPLERTYVLNFLTSDPVLLRRALEVAAPHEVEVSVVEEETVTGASKIEVRSKLATKGVALHAVMARLGVSKKDVLVFGDQLNDLPLFEVAGEAVAVANAHPALQAVASALCDANDADGVAHFLARRFLGHRPNS